MKKNKEENKLETKIINTIIIIAFFGDLSAFILAIFEIIPFYFLLPIIVVPICLIILYGIIKYFIICPPKEPNQPNKEKLYETKKVINLNNKNKD